MSTKDKHPTEVKYPNQCKQFKKMLDSMYATHLDKNLDYSPMNVLGTGELGTVVRLWDKMARLMSLYGFEIYMTKAGEYTKPKVPKNESVEDTLEDMANYAVILNILRSGNWGN